MTLRSILLTLLFLMSNSSLAQIQTTGPIHGGLEKDTPFRAQVMEHTRRNVILVPIHDQPSWHEFAFLASIPASQKGSGLMPAVVALDSFGLIPEEVTDYLDRYHPSQVYRVGEEAEWSVAHWALDEGAGQTLADRSGNDHHGTLTGGTWVEGVLELDGFDDYVEITGYTGISGAASRTVAAWIKTTEANGEIISWGRHGAPGESWVMAIDENGFLCLEVGNAYISGTTDLRDGQWHHVAAVLNNEGEAVIDNTRLFVDGYPELIGTIWDGASGTLNNNLIGYWRLNEGTGQSIGDESKGNNAGACFTDIGAGGDYPDWGPGLLGTGLYFDNRDYIQIDNEAYFDSTRDAFSLSCWVKHSWSWGVGGNDQFLTKGNKYYNGWELGRAYDSDWGKVSASSQDVESGDLAVTDVWHHVVATYDGRDLSLYVNSSLEDSKRISTMAGNNAPVRIGCGDHDGTPSPSGPTGGRYNGWIDEVAIWDRALQQSEIDTLYNSGSGMVIDTHATQIQTADDASVKLGVFEGSFNYFNGCMEDLRIYDRALNETEILSLKMCRDQSLAGISSLAATSLDEVTCALAATFWKSADRVVLCDREDYTRALTAAPLAARLKAPLFFFDAGTGLSAEVLARITGLSPGSALLAGANALVVDQLAGLGISTQQLAEAVDVIAWLKTHGLSIDYLAAANPRDRELGRVPKSSLAGALLAAGRRGALVPFTFDTVWKEPFWYSASTGTQPPGAPNSKTGNWYLGSFSLGMETYDFVISTNADTTSYNRLNIDLDQNQYFGDSGEGPYESADVVEVEGKRYALSLATQEFYTPGHVKFTYPSAEEMNEVLAPYYAVLGRHPEYLCVIGLQDAIPFGLANGYYAYADAEDVPSDALLADVDDDPFYEIAVGRVFGENRCYATLLAARSLTYPALVSKPNNWCLGSMWTGEFWDQMFVMPHKLANVGFPPSVIHSHEPDYDKSKLSIVIQDDHGGPGGFSLGWDCNLETLLAPCVIDAGGCDTAGIDMAPLDQLGSVRMLRKGAVTYIGTQRGTPEDKRVYRQNLWNAVLTGATLGQGHRWGLNCMKVAYLDEVQPPVYADYCLHSEAFYGDPAVKIFIPSAPLLAPARVQEDGDTLQVIAPETYWVDYLPGPPPYTGYWHTGPGLHPDYDESIQFFMARWDCPQPVTRLTQEPGVPAPLGWVDGQWFLDEHQDGTWSVYWRMRFQEFDKATSQVLQEMEQIDYTVRF